MLIQFSRTYTDNSNVDWEFPSILKMVKMLGYHVVWFWTDIPHRTLNVVSKVGIPSSCLINNWGEQLRRLLIQCALSRCKAIITQLLDGNLAVFIGLSHRYITFSCNSRNKENVNPESKWPNLSKTDFYSC